MSIVTMILGESGTGKTSALRNFNPDDVLLIQAIKKPLPFKATGWGYRTKENQHGNIFVTDEQDMIMNLLHKTQRKVIVIDDVQYIMANEYMRRSHELGFQKFTDIGKSIWNIINKAMTLDDDVRVYLLWHTATDDFGKTKAKTIGKLLDDKITIEGMVSIVLRTVVINGNYLFATHNSGNDTVKSPIGLFGEETVENDLSVIDSTICNFYFGE